MIPTTTTSTTSTTTATTTTRRRRRRGCSILWTTSFILLLLLLLQKTTTSYHVASSWTWAWTTNTIIHAPPSSCTMNHRAASSSSSSSSFFGGQKGAVAAASRLRTTNTRRLPLSMKINVAICGLPNIGKSSLFNALQRSSSSSNTGSSSSSNNKNNLARVENFPFCTIDPNVAKVPLPDHDHHYLQDLAVLANSSRVVPANIEWVDVAGLVKGAHNGEGLGNQFLGTVRSCHSVCHVVRAFEDCTTTTSRKDEGVVHHVEGRVDPLEDLHTVHLEFVLADLAHVERRLARTNNCVGTMERDALEMILPMLQQGWPARSALTTQGGLLSDEMEKSIRSMGLLTLKPVVYAFNVDEVDFLLDYETTLQRARDTVRQFTKEYCEEEEEDVVDLDDYDTSSSTTTTAKKDMNNVVLVSAKLEAALAALPDETARNTYLRETVGVDDTTTTTTATTSTTTTTTTTLEELQLQSSARVLPKSIQTLLDLFVVYTGPGVPPERSKTTRAHLCRRFSSSSSSSQPSTMMMMTTLDLAKRLHGDIAKGFIKAEVIPAPKLLECDSYTAAKEAGLVRTEGKDALLRPDDVVLIKWK